MLHDPIKNRPPKGVIGPKNDNETPNKSCKFNRYMDNENRITPTDMNCRAIFNLSVK